MNSQGTLQVDLAVEPRGISRVGQLFELVQCQRLSDDDPVILMQPDYDIHMRRFCGYTHVLRRYTEAYGLRQTDSALTEWYVGEIEALKALIQEFR